MSPAALSGPDGPQGVVAVVLDVLVVCSGVVLVPAGVVVVGSGTVVVGSGAGAGAVCDGVVDVTG